VDIRAGGHIVNTEAQSEVKIYFYRMRRRAAFSHPRKTLVLGRVYLFVCLPNEYICAQGSEFVGENHTVQNGDSRLSRRGGRQLLGSETAD